MATPKSSSEGKMRTRQAQDAASQEDKSADYRFPTKQAVPEASDTKARHSSHIHPHK
jgi:hypothetical protein